MIYKEYLTRQADIIPVQKVEALRVLVVGAGAVGSFATLALAKMGVELIEVYDDDTVDTVNLNSQFYPMHSVGLLKVSALHSMIQSFTGVSIKVNATKYKETSAIYDIVLLAVDNMAARKFIFDTVQAKYLIDSRMSAEKYAQYVVDMRSTDSKATYTNTLYTDSEAVTERCTAKATIYTALTSASMVCKAVKNILANEPYPRTILMDLQQSQNNTLMFK